MKIVGVTYGERKSMILKGDSALLVNHKPFFIPDQTHSPVAYPALALRVCRLGKTISPRFANRYYDALAPALDIQAADLIEECTLSGTPWTEAVSMDGSFPLGEWGSIEAGKPIRMLFREQAFLVTEESIAEAVSLVSSVMTIRQGDVLYLQAGEPIALQYNDTLRARFEGDETDRLTCRIK